MSVQRTFIPIAAILSLFIRCATDADQSLSLMTVLLAITGPTYHVDASGGSDDSDGLTETSAWRTLDKVNASSLARNSTILFKRGEFWRGQLIPRSGIFYGAYGTGEKPVIMGSVDKSAETDWALEGGSIWRCTETFSTDTGNLIFNSASDFGIKKWSPGDLSLQGDYYYNRSTGELLLFSSSNPGLYYSGIEVALRRHVVDYQGVSRASFDGLSIKYGAAHGFGGGNTALITIRNCDISFIGGGDILMDGSNIRFGNGIEFWGKAHDHLVESNRLWEIYDSALTNQNHTQVVSQYNIIYRNNLIWNCAMSSFEYWNRPEGSVTRNIIFENNTCLWAGEGWGKPPQRPDTYGAHILFFYDQGDTSGIIIRNNIFFEGNLGLWIENYSHFSGILSMDYNCWHQDSGTMMELFDIPAAYTMAQFDDFRTLTGLGMNSITGEPVFENTSLDDFHLQPGSPCVDEGLFTGLVYDFDGISRPQGAYPDMGAYER